MASTPTPSAKLIRAAQGEIERVQRARQIAEQRRATLLAELAELDRTVEGYARRQQLLDELLNEPAAPAEAAPPTPTPAAPGSWASRRAVRGRELRRIAGRLLWASEREHEIHYRDWFERVMTAGFATGGKDPAASFLTNIRDSPAVARGTRPGYYRLDPHSLTKIHSQIGETQAELADLEHTLQHADASSARPAHIERLRAHQHDLKQLLKRKQGEAEELQYIFHEDQAATDPTTSPHALLAA